MQESTASHNDAQSPAIRIESSSLSHLELIAFSVANREPDLFITAPISLRTEDYFPMQNVEKIKFKISSEVVCPVSESSAQSPR
jgi:hypothetical protein